LRLSTTPLWPLRVCVCVTYGWAWHMYASQSHQRCIRYEVRLRQREALQCTATHCNALQHAATHCNTLQHAATHCNTLQQTATHCNTLQHTVCMRRRETREHCNAYRTATHCNTLQHTATHCNALQRTATHCVHTSTAPPCNTTRPQNGDKSVEILQRTAAHCNALQHNATHYNTLHAYVYCTTLQHATSTEWRTSL